MATNYVAKFYCCKIIPSGIGFNQKFSWKMFLLKMFYGCKIISSETPLNQNFPVANFLWLQNHFLGNTFEGKILSKKFWLKNFCGSKIISCGIGLNWQFSWKIFWLNFLWLQNHFLGNRFEIKICIESFLSKIFIVGKSFPRE